MIRSHRLFFLEGHRASQYLDRVTAIIDRRADRIIETIEKVL